MDYNHTMTTIVMNTTADFMLNSTTPIPFPMTEGCKLYDFLTKTVFIGTLCILGVIGNILAFAVFQLDTLKTSTTFLFQGLSVVDSFFLVCCFMLYSTAPFVSYVWGGHKGFEIVFHYQQIYVYPAAMTFQTATIWVTVLVGVNRYIAVCMPYQSARLCNVAKAKQYLALVLVFSILYNIPRCFTGEICENEDDGSPEACLTEFGKNKWYDIIYNNVLYTIFMLALPLVILTVLNIKLIKTLNTIKKRRSQMQTRQQQQDNNVTFVLIIVLLVFTVCQLPALFTQIFWSILPDNTRVCGGFQFFYSRLSNLMVILNSAVNIIIYMLFNNRFKSVMQEKVFICKSKTFEDENDCRNAKANGASQTLLTHV